MNKCTHKKFNGSLNDDNLETLGSVSVNFTKGNGYLFVKCDAPDFLISLIGNGNLTGSDYTADYGKTYAAAITYSNGIPIYVKANEDLRIELKNIPYGAKVDFAFITNCYMDFTRLSKYWKIAQLKAYTSGVDYWHMSGDISDINTDELYDLSIPNTDNVVGNISALQGAQKLYNLTINSKKIIGNITSLVNCGWDLYSGTVMNISKSSIQGSFESFVEALFAAGKIVDTLIFNAYQSQVTFHDAPAPYASVNINVTSEGATIVNRSTSAIIASYDGMSWIYN